MDLGWTETVTELGASSGFVALRPTSYGCITNICEALGSLPTDVNDEYLAVVPLSPFHLLEDEASSIHLR